MAREPVVLVSNIRKRSELKGKSHQDQADYIAALRASGGVCIYSEADEVMHRKEAAVYVRVVAALDALDEWRGLSQGDLRNIKDLARLQVDREWDEAKVS